MLLCQELYIFYFLNLSTDAVRSNINIIFNIEMYEKLKVHDFEDDFCSPVCAFCEKELYEMIC